jgi:tetratricopeptide (TPR) repeat protein
MRCLASVRWAWIGLGAAGFVLIQSCRTASTVGSDADLSASNPLLDAPALSDVSSVHNSARLRRPTEPCEPTGSACFKRAEQLLDDHPKDGQDLLTQCLACQDAPPAAYRLLSGLYESSGDREQARSVLEVGVRRYAYSVLLWQALARAEMAMSRYREGLSAMATAHRLRPDDDAVAEEYRFLLAKYGTPEDRREAQIHPLLVEAQGRLEIDDVQGAIMTLNEALKLSGPVKRLRGLVLFRLANVHLRQGEMEEADKTLGRALDEATEPTALRADILVARTEILLSREAYAEARAAAAEAAELAPQSPLPFANLAVALAMLGDKDGAIVNFGLAFDRGLGRRLTQEEFLSLGPSINLIRSHAQFAPMMRRAWPRLPYPPAGHAR